MSRKSLSNGLRKKTRDIASRSVLCPATEPLLEIATAVVDLPPSDPTAVALSLPISHMNARAFPERSLPLYKTNPLLETPTAFGDSVRRFDFKVPVSGFQTCTQAGNCAGVDGC